MLHGLGIVERVVVGGRNDFNAVFQAYLGGVSARRGRSYDLLLRGAHSGSDWALLHVLHEVLELHLVLSADLQALLALELGFGLLVAAQVDHLARPFRAQSRHHLLLVGLKLVLLVLERAQDLLVHVQRSLETRAVVLPPQNALALLVVGHGHQLVVVVDH